MPGGTNHFALEETPDSPDVLLGFTEFIGCDRLDRLGFQVIGSCDLGTRLLFD